MSEEDDDISLLSLSDDEGQAPQAKAPQAPQRGQTGSSSKEPDFLEQATLWAEVDTDELERVAVNIAQNAVVQTDNAEAVSRLNITASAIESDNMDPLGFGRIDTRVLALTRADSAGAVKGKGAGRGAAPDAGRKLSRAGRRSDAPDEGEVASGALRSKVLPASEQFDPELYLRVIHADSSLAELTRGLHSLKLNLSEHTGQLKALVKENFERFISSKNTIDDIYAKLQKAEAEGEMGVDGASSSEVMAAVLQVQDEARRAFGALLDRQSKAERIKSVLGIIRRYEAVVRLPSRVREHAEAHDYEQVVADYRKARALLADHTSELPQQAQRDSMWLKLLEEIDKVVTSVVVTLETALRSAQSGAGEAHDAIKYLLQLQAVGSQAAQGLNPVRLYVESQERHMMGALEAQQAQHRERMAALQRRQQETEDREAQLATLANLGITPPPSAVAAPNTPTATTSADLGSATQLATVQHVARLTAALAQWLPPFWGLTQVRLPGLASIGNAAASVEAGMAEAEAAAGRVIAAFKQATKQALSRPPGLDAAGQLAVLREVVAGCVAVQQQAPAEGPEPAAALDVLRALAEAAAKQCLVQLRGELDAAVGRLCDGEDWAVDLTSQRAGAPVTGTVAGLGRTVEAGMQHLRSALEEAARIQVNPLRKSAAPARDAFFGCFRAFGAGLERLAAGLDQQQQHPQQERQQHAQAPGAASKVGSGGGAAALPTVGRRLLLLCSNATAVRTRLLSRLFRSWAGVLAAGGSPKEGQAAATECAAELERVEHSLVMAYIDRKQAALDEVMEEFFFSDGTAWEAAPPPTACRPVALDLLHALAHVQAELGSTAPGVMFEVVAELVTSLAEGFAEMARGGDGLPPGITPGGVCQLWLEARYLSAAVGGMAWPALAEALRALDAALAQRLQRALDHSGLGAAAQLRAWCGGGGGNAAALVQACGARVAQLCEDEAAGSAANLAPLRMLGGGAMPAAARRA